MRSGALLVIVIAAGSLGVAPGGAAPAPDRALSSDVDPDLPPPFFRRNPNGIPPSLPGRENEMPGARPPVFGPDGALREPPAAIGRSLGNETPPEPSRPPPTRAETLDRLFARLAAAGDQAEAQGIATLVEGLWMRSGSDTADFLMQRAVAAIEGHRNDVAEALLDKILDLQPAWAEAWNKRATLRFIAHDDRGSMEDISHVLALEPRHFGALGGMGYILERHGEDQAALKALRRALDIYPQNPELRKAVDKLTPTVEGQDL